MSVELKKNHPTFNIDEVTKNNGMVKQKI